MEQQISSMEKQKWVTKLLGYDYKIVYKKLVENMVIDALLQLLEQVIMVGISGPSWTTLNQIRKEWWKDPEIQNIIKRLKEA